MADQRMAPASSIGRRSGILLASRVVGSAGFFVAVTILARGLEPAGRGAIAFLTVAALSVGAIVRVGSSDATFVMATRTPRLAPVLFANLLTWALGSSAVGGVLAALALWVARDSLPPGLGPVEIAAVAVGTVFSALVEAGTPMLLARGRVTRQALITASAPWLYAFLLFSLVLTASLTVRSAAIAWLASQAIWGGSLVFAALDDVGLQRPQLALLKEILRFGLQAWVGNLAYFLNARVDQLILGVLGTAAMLGQYAVAVNAAEIVLYVPTAAAQALLSAVAGDAEEVRAARVARALRGSFIVTLLLSVVAGLSGPYAVPIVFGTRYDGSVLPLLLLLPGAMGFTAMTILGPALLLARSPRLASIGPCAALVMGVFLDFVLIPPFGANGAALAASGALLAGGGVMLVAYHNRTGAPWSSLVPSLSDLGLLRSLITGAIRPALRRGVD